MKLMLKRMLQKGSIVAKKAYCDRDPYKEFKPATHAAAFELIEIPIRGTPVRTRPPSAWSLTPSTSTRLKSTSIHS